MRTRSVGRSSSDVSHLSAFRKKLALKNPDFPNRGRGSKIYVYEQEHAVLESDRSLLRVDFDDDDTLEIVEGSMCEESASETFPAGTSFTALLNSHMTSNEELCDELSPNSSFAPLKNIPITDENKTVY